MNASTLFIVFVSGLLVLAAWSRLAELYRKSALSRAAAALGMRFEERAGRFITSGPGSHPLFRAGGAVGRHLVSDGRVALFEHLSRAASAGGMWRTVGAAKVGAMPSFRLEFKRPGVFGLVGSAYTPADEVTLDAPDAFHERYQLFSDDEAATRALFSDAAVAFFAAHGGYCVESRAGWLVVDEGIGMMDPGALAKQLDAVRTLAGLFEARARRAADAVV